MRRQIEDEILKQERRSKSKEEAPSKSLHMMQHSEVNRGT